MTPILTSQITDLQIREEELPSYQEENLENIENVRVLRLIAKTRFPVYLTQTSSTGQKLALKLFSFKQGRPNKYYLNESRFEPLNHPNVIQIVSTLDETEISFTKTTKKYSCILMEYAPYGDFFEFFRKCREDLTEKLVRTYFRQLIEGLDYLHKTGVYHLDLKLENLLMGNDYQLKIADFDLAYFAEDPKIISQGTQFHRAPEIKAVSCKDPAAADVYSAGILLFVFKCGGVIPHTEETLCEGINLADLLEDDPEEFFERHAEIQGRDSWFFDPAFRELFLGMTREDPRDRMTIADIMKSQWYLGPVYTREELKLQARKLHFNGK